MHARVSGPKAVGRGLVTGSLCLLQGTGSTPLPTTTSSPHRDAENPDQPSCDGRNTPGRGANRGSWDSDGWLGVLGPSGRPGRSTWRNPAGQLREEEGVGARPAPSGSRPLLAPAGWGRPRAEGSPRAPAPREFQARVSARSASPPLRPPRPPRPPRLFGAESWIPEGAGRGPEGTLPGAGLPPLPPNFCAPRVAAPPGKEGGGPAQEDSDWGRDATGPGRPRAPGIFIRLGERAQPARQTDEIP